MDSDCLATATKTTNKKNKKSSETTTTTTPLQTKLIYIVPYSMIEKIYKLKLLKPDQFGIVIADESHNLKNQQTFNRF